MTSYTFHINDVETRPQSQSESRKAQLHIRRKFLSSPKSMYVGPE